MAQCLRAAVAEVEEKEKKHDQQHQQQGATAAAGEGAAATTPRRAEALFAALRRYESARLERSTMVQEQSCAQ